MTESIFSKISNLQNWTEKVTAELQGKSPDVLHRKFIDGRIQKILYSVSDCADLPPLYLQQNSEWARLSKYSKMESRQLNKKILQDIEGGISAISLHSDNFWSTGAIDDIFDGVYPQMLDIHFHDQGSLLGIGFLRKWAKENEIDYASLNVYPNLDPVQYLTHITDLSEQFLSSKGRFFSLSSQEFHLNGSTDSTEIALLLSKMLYVLKEAKDQKKKIFDQIVVHIPIESNLLGGIVKIRSLRNLLDKLQNLLGFDRKIPIYTETSLRMMSRIDPFVNVLRATLSASASVIGGVDGISILPFESAFLEEEDNKSASDIGFRMARNIHSLLGEEVLMGFTQDPARGSYYFESQTDALSRLVWDKVQEWEREGGYLSIQPNIAKILKKEQEKREQMIACGKIMITGVSSFPPTKRDFLEISDAQFEREIQKEIQWQQARGSLETTEVEKMEVEKMEESDSLISVITKMIEKGYTRQELLSVIPKTSVDIFDSGKRDAEIFETIVFSHQTSNQQLFLLQLGDLRDYAQRKSWIENMVRAGGFVFHEHEHSDEKREGDIDTEIDVQLQNMSTHTKIVILCASDQMYQAHGNLMVSKIKNKNSNIKILLAGHPAKSNIDQVNIDFAMYQGCNHVEILNKILEVVS